MSVEDSTNGMSRRETELEEASGILEANRAERERALAQLQESLDALSDRLSELRDWRGWIRRRPTPFLAVSFGLGLLLGWRRARRE